MDNTITEPGSVTIYRCLFHMENSLITLVQGRNIYQISGNLHRLKLRSLKNNTLRFKDSFKNYNKIWHILSIITAAHTTIIIKGILSNKRSNPIIRAICTHLIHLMLSLITTLFHKASLCNNEKTTLIKQLIIVILMKTEGKLYLQTIKATLLISNNREI